MRLSKKGNLIDGVSKKGNLIDGISKKGNLLVMGFPKKEIVYDMTFQKRKFFDEFFFV
jgi:hypothetical protein